MKKTYIIIGIICVIAIVVIFSSFSSTSKQTHVVLSPTPVPVALSTQQALQKDSIFNDRVDKRPVLSASDKNAKDALLKNFSPEHEILYQNSEFAVSYVTYFDQFQVEVRSSNYSKAEHDATTWFGTKGISKDGVCELPVMFYPSFALKQSLDTSRTELPSLGLSCQ